jgi:hypothetical protein
MNHLAWLRERRRKRDPEGDQGSPMTMSELKTHARRATETAKRQLAIAEAKAGLSPTQRSRGSTSTRQRSTAISDELAVAQDRHAAEQLDKLEAKVRALYRRFPPLRASLRHGPVVTTVTAGGRRRRIEIRP